MPPAAARIGRMVPALLRERREFRRDWTGHTISLFGDEITLLALPLTAVLVLDASPAQVGYLSAAALAPNLLFSVHAGAWVDRRQNRRRIMIAADLGRAGLLASIPLAYALGTLTLGQLYVVAFLAGTLSALFTLAQATLFVAITPRDRYIEANTLLYGSRALSFVGGPSLAACSSSLPPAQPGAAGRAGSHATLLGVAWLARAGAATGAGDHSAASSASATAVSGSGTSARGRGLLPQLRGGPSGRCCATAPGRTRLPCGVGP